MGGITQEQRDRYLSHYFSEERKVMDYSLTNAITSYLDVGEQVTLFNNTSFKSIDGLTLIINPGIYYKVFGFFKILISDVTKNVRISFNPPGTTVNNQVRGVVNFIKLAIIGDLVPTMSSYIVDTATIVDGGTADNWVMITADLIVSSQYLPWAFSPTFAQHTAGNPATQILFESHMIAIPLNPITSY